LKYRSDIDGLRTIAVFLVILNHAGFTFLTGGFIGVDVFFVISGFLITSIIYPKIVDGSFRFTWFISRRLKRLMPILLFVIFITACVFSFIMFPQDLMKLYRSIYWVIFNGGNFFFWIEHGGYFAGNSQEAPLLHTWSLAVEEQYYLLWPLILIMAVKFLSVKNTMILTFLGCIAATIFAQWGAEVTTGAAYYLLPTRFFELMIGSCLAMYWDKLPNINQMARNVLSLVGLTLIIGSAIILTEHHTFPGYNALYGVLGTAMIIFAATGWVNKLLSFKPVVFTGNISYSLYLWHWPVFAFFRYTSVEFTLLLQITSIVFIYILSIISWKYIEQPFRRSKLDTFPEIGLKMYVLPSSVILILVTIGLYNKGFEQRYSPEIVKMEQAINSYANESRGGCHSASRESENLPSEDCIFGVEENSSFGKTNVFVIGDSHANHLIPFIEVLAINGNLVGQDYTLDQCVPVFGLYWGAKPYMADKCKKRNDIAKAHIQNSSFDFVVLAGSWPNENTKNIFDGSRVVNSINKQLLFEDKFILTVRSIIQSGAIPILFRDTPVLGGKSPKCPIKKLVFNDDLNCSISIVKNQFMDELINKLHIEFPEIIVLDPTKAYCSSEGCDMSYEGTPLYRDDDHLNEFGARLLGIKLLEGNVNPLMTNNKY
jgi:peptidoglycan/LPS O-acetylase OafA/YrhL